MGILENIMGTKEQNETAQKNLDKQASEGGKLAKMLGGNATPKESKEVPKEVVKKAKGGKVAGKLATRGYGKARA
jgi:uncharacterized protein (DUF2225 family)